MTRRTQRPESSGNSSGSVEAMGVKMKRFHFLSEEINSIYRIFIIALMATLVSSAAGCALKYSRSSSAVQPSEVFDQAVAIIEHNYVDDSGKKVTLDTSKRPDINSLISQLSPRSRWLINKVGNHPPEGEIGARVKLNNGSFEIIRVLGNNPAQQAGLHRGDKIIEIDNEPVAGLSELQVIEKLEGDPDTEVVLKIENKNNETKVLRITRKTIKPVPYVASRMIENKLGYMRIASFGDETPSKVEEAVKRLVREDMRGLILDLRNNSGGLFDSLVKTSQLLLKPGEIICTLTPNEANEGRVYKAGGWAHYTKFPLVILVDSHTESGAEIIAAALKENKRALLVGEKTPGSGEIQTLYPLKDGSALRIRVAFAHTPTGKRIEGRGVQPDREVMMSGADMDALYDRIDSSSNVTFGETAGDIQLKTAVTLLREQIANNEQ